MGFILDRIGESVPADKLKRLPEFLIDFFAAKERFLRELTNLKSFMELPADIRIEMFESSKPLREKMLERLIPIVMQELGVDDGRIRELARDTAEKRKLYKDMLFPRVAGNVRMVGLRFDEVLVWRKADELMESIAVGKLSYAD